MTTDHPADEPAPPIGFDRSETADTEQATAEPDDAIRAAGGDIGDQVEIAGALDSDRIRRAPKYRSFAVVGGLIGLVLAIVATPFARESQYMSYPALFILVTLTLVPVCVLCGCFVAVLLDRRKS